MDLFLKISLLIFVLIIVASWLLFTYGVWRILLTDDDQNDGGSND